MSTALDVLSCYPTPCRGAVTPLGNHGGFSGAQLFRIDTPLGSFCLRAWPAPTSAEQLAFIHTLLQRAGRLDFVPRVLPTSAGGTIASAAGRLWDMTTWLPGSAHFERQPTTARLRAACVALAQLHRAWADGQPTSAPVPAVERRLAAVRAWLPLRASGWQPPDDPLDPVWPWARRAWPLLCTQLPELERQLAPWRDSALPLQPCLCDLWHDHVLFEGERVTGLVDFGSCKLDHVAVDLARLLGSLVGDDDARWQEGFDAYARERQLSADERRLARDLDRSGVFVAAANWLRWLYHERRVFADRDVVARRLARLVERLESSAPRAGR